MLCLVGRISVEDEWSKTTHDRALSSDGGPMWYKLLVFVFVANMRLGKATRGKRRIPDGKVGERWRSFSSRAKRMYLS
jgi:hypothetical protein